MDSPKFDGLSLPQKARSKCGVDIRIAVDEPLSPEPLNALYTAVGWNNDGHRTTEKTAEALRRSDFIGSAWHGEELVGFVRVCGDPYCAQVLDMIVDPGFRRQGIATRLLAEVRAFLERSTYRSVTLTDGSHLDGLYVRNGFRRVASDTPTLVFRPSLPEDAVV